jgi:four helix bundle protein
MGYQIIRSCDSIAANMAEGYGRFSPADRRKFYLYARGPQEETKSWLRKAIRRQIIRSDDEIRAFKEVIDELGPKLNAFISKTTVDAVREAGPDAPISNFEFQLSSSESTERSETYAKKN